VTANNTNQTIKVKRNWVLISLLFLGIYTLAFLVGVLLQADFTLTSVGSGVISLVGCGLFYKTHFNKPVIIATADSIWTGYLKKVKWDRIKDIRIEKHRPHKSPSATTELVIETTAGYKDEFDMLYLDAEANTLLYQLRQHWLSSKA
jgi:hypothetical protein